VKNLFLLIILFAACRSSKQQTIPAAPPSETVTNSGDSPAQPGYLRFPTIPPFTLLSVDSSQLTRDNLHKNKKTIIMYFSPSCEHCQHETDSLVAHMNQFRDVEILMATYQPYEEMKAFYDERKLRQFSNLKMGHDTKYFFPPFYKMVNLPFMALYDNKGKFITSFEGTTGMEKILAAFNR
jgi:cytochrome oxidase Cu insertion factor (SCO1/SenC/PrrC family)